MKLDQRLVQLIATRQATAKDLEGVAPEAVWEVKSNPEIVQFAFKAADAIVVDEEKRVLRYEWTNESVDSDGDIVRAKGWDFSRYKLNPVVLWAHDPRGRPPIGKALKVFFEGNTNPRGFVDIEFAPKDAHEFADTIYQLSKRNFLKGISPGFNVLEASTLTQKEREAMGLGPYGIECVRQKLFEKSICSLPANEQALRVEMKGLVDQGVVRDQTMREFEKAFPLTEKDWERRIAEITRSFVDFGRNKGVETTVFDFTGATVKDVSAVAGLEPISHVELVDALTKNTEATTKLVGAVESLVAAQAKQAEALAKQSDSNTRLVQAVSDLTRKTALVGDAPGGSNKGPAASTSDARGSNPPSTAVKDAGDEIAARLKSLQPK